MYMPAPRSHLPSPPNPGRLLTPFRSRRRATLWGLVVATLFLVLATSATAWLSTGESVNYLHPEAPVYTGTYAPEPAPSDDRVIVVTYNLQYGEEAAEAVEEFRADEHLAIADLVLLQEVDQESTEFFARSLGYDYVYYPASIHPKTGRNMGNAVLSRAPLEEKEKLLLPHTSPFNGQRRIATRAETTLEGIDLAASSVHLETQLLSAEERRDQMGAVAAADAGAGPAVVAGDLNTAPGGDLSLIAEPLAAIGFTRASAGAGDTWSLGPLDAALDHVFVRGFDIVASSAVTDSSSSDHLPLWVELETAP